MRENFSTASMEAGHSYTSRTFDDGPLDSLIVLTKLVSILTVFYSCGRVIGNPHAKRETVLLIGVLWICGGPTLQTVLHGVPILSYLYVASVIAIQAGIGAVSSQPRHRAPRDKRSTQDAFLQPMIFPCRTTHTRFFPTKHTFSYSYLLVGVPVEWNGAAGALLSAGDGLTHPAWFSVHPDDYLSRSRSKTHVGLHAKLKAYLSSQGISPERYRHAYLVTAPRILGFSFNPVSFWYLYGHDRNLHAMILEVNNTFDERRMYLMQHDLNDKRAASHEVFSNSWSKDFHVSPFNDRGGSYSLTAKDFMKTDPGVSLDNNIVLRDEGGKAKIVARVFSTEPGINPYTTSTVQSWMFLARWWWVGFMTNPRILREARILWVKKLQVYYRPEVLKSSIGRNETLEEATLEPFFRAFLTELTDVLDEPVVVSYSPAAGPDRGGVVRLGASSTGDTRSSLTIGVMTPAFYSEVVRCKSIEQAFSRFCFDPTDGEAMVNVSDQELLQRLLQNHVSRHDGVMFATHQFPIHVWLMTHLRSGSMKLLGRDVWNKLRGRKIRPPPLSGFDEFMSLSCYPHAAYKAYLRCAIRLLLADRVALGFVWLLTSYRLLVCVLCSVQVGHVIEALCSHSLSMGRLLSLILCLVLVHGSGAFLAVPDVQ